MAVSADVGQSSCPHRAYEYENRYRGYTGNIPTTSGGIAKNIREFHEYAKKRYEYEDPQHAKQGY
eukprot:scaffold159543_cov31-Prasinocladus_malaysianus.AAC.1